MSKLFFEKSGKKILDSQKQYLKKRRVYPCFLYSRLDKWLKSMSLKGWQIVHCGLLTFWFEKCEPEEKEYFTYGLATQEGRYSISMRYPFLDKTYGVQKKKSKINGNDAKTYHIVEIDIKKISENKKLEIGYKELIHDRNCLYLQHFAFYASITALVIVLFLLLCLI